MAKDNLSKVVNDRLKAVESVQSALTEVSDKLASGAEALFGPHLKKDEDLPNFALIAELTKRVLRARAEEMATADAAHNVELADDAEPRERRDAKARQVYADIVQIKGEAFVLFGPSWVTKLALPAEVPQDPLLLSRTAVLVRKAISAATLPKPKVAGVSKFDKAPWLAMLKGPVEDLDQAIKDVSREEREGQTTLIAKQRSMEAFLDVFTKGTAMSAALLRLVGEREHADRLRPSARRPGQLEEEEEDSNPAASPEESASSPDDSSAPAGAAKIVAAAPKISVASAKKKATRKKRR